MPKFEGQVLTNLGSALMAKSIARGVPTPITRIAVGDGTLEQSVPFHSMTQLVHEVQSITQVQKRVVESQVAQLDFTIRTDQLAAGFWFRELGIYAMDPDLGEILYSYENLGNMADYLPAFGGATSVRRTVCVFITVGNAENVTISVGDPQGSVVFIPSVDEEGNLSWTNTGGLTNPPTVNIRGTGIGEAPKDEKLYGRKDGAWELIPEGSGGAAVGIDPDVLTVSGTSTEFVASLMAAEFPDNSILLGDVAFSDLPGSLVTASARVTVFPNQTYLMEIVSDDNADVWKSIVTVPGAGSIPAVEWSLGSFDDAPSNDGLYARKNGAWALVPPGGGEANSYPTFELLVADAENVQLGAVVKTLGYYAVNDEGAATYEITEEALHPWDIEISEGKYASIKDRDVVRYRMFGAPLNGIDDDGPAMRKAHAYADSIHTIDGSGKIPIYTCRIENHTGIIYKKDTDAITFNSDIDLSGSVLLVNDTNAAWFGIYVWGDNDSLRWSYEPSPEMKATFLQDNHVINPSATDGVLPGNIVIRYEETPYAARDDAGYSYTVGRKELMIHDMDGMSSSPFTDDWTRAGGQEISVLVSDLVHGGYKTETFYTTFTTSYNDAHPKHGTFVGCDVQLDMSANKYHCVVWVKRHNATIKNFTFRPNKDKLHNTAYKNTMIYLWDSYNVEVSGLQGFNAAGKKIGTSKATSGYILRLTNCSDVHVHDCRLQGYWGATAMDSVKNIRFDRCHINRLDIHDYFANLWANECVFYNSAIQIGYGRGIASFTNSRFHLNPAPGDSYPGSYICAFNMSYGRIFEGTVRVENCQVYGRNLPDNEFNMFKAEFSPNATSVTPHFKFPEIIATNVQVYSADPSAHYSYFKITGTRRGTTSGVRPSHVKDVSGDGTVRWRFFGRSVEWGDTVTSISVGQILRVMDTFLDNEDPPKTQFYNKRYYRCTQAGTLSFGGSKPTATSGTITVGTAQLAYVGPDVMWKSRHAYSVGNVCAVSHSNWFPMELYICEQAGTSNGFFPVHTSGTVIDGINDAINEPDTVWWTYVGTKASWCTNWTAGMTVTNGQRILVEDRIYEVTQAGVLPSLPPYITMWFGVHDWGTARLRFIGKQWGPKEWYPKDSFCEARGNIYQVANHDGATSGILPVRGKEYCIDGDIVWKHVSGSNTLPGQTGSDTWQAQHAYNIGDTVVANANTYECEFDGKMVLPHKSVFKNIVTNMSNGQVFWFYTGTNIPTRAGDKPWTIIAEDCEGIAQAVKFPSGMTKYFGNANNTNPTAILATTGSGGSGGDGIQDAPSDGKTYGRKNGAWDEVTEFAEAPTGGAIYGRKDGAWTAVPEFEDAPSDGTMYARKDGTWEAVAGAGADGKSAYEVWLDAGNVGTVEDYLASLVGEDGLDGLPGPVGMHWRGAWSSSTAYAANDAVSYAGSSYIAIAESTNIIPSGDLAKWEPLALKGVNGEGAGDMIKQEYDSDEDGKVNAAVTADTANGVSYIDLTTPPAAGQALVYDGATSKFKPGTVATEGVEEAPEDGKLYARKDGGWAEVPEADSVEMADVQGLAEALAGKMPKSATVLTATNDLNTDATTAGYYVTAWNTANNPASTACLVQTIPGASASAAFSQIAVALSQNKMYFRTSYWVDTVLTFNSWIDLTAGGSSEGGLPTGGTGGQILAKATATDYDAHWIDPPSGGTGMATDSTRNNVRVLMDLARYHSAGGTGMMKISFGAAISTDIFLQGEITGYNHATKTPWRCEFGGWAGAGSWGGFSVVLYPNCPFTSVRPAHDGTSLCLLLGTTGTSWSYPIVSVPRVQVAYGGMASVPAQWTLSLIASEAGLSIGTVTSTKTISAV